MIPSYPTLKVSQAGAVLTVAIDAPPLNLLGPDLVHDLVSLLQLLETDDTCRVVVFSSADPDFFISHVDVTKVAQYRQEAARLTGEASLASLFRRLSTLSKVTIAQIDGRARGAGSEFALSCDMSFAAKETAIFSQFEAGFGLAPGGGGIQHLVRLMGRNRALEVLLSADDYDAELAERYGWINRAVPKAHLPEFVTTLAHRIASFPAVAQKAIKDRVNFIALASPEDFRVDSDLFGTLVRDVVVQKRMKIALERGFQTRVPEHELSTLVGNLGTPATLEE